MKGLVGLTGTPGTGKKTIAPLVAASLGIPRIGLNDFATSSGLASPRKESEVDPRTLGRSFLRQVRGSTLVYGHLLPYAFAHGAFQMVIVLRCEPGVLKRRLQRRRYSTGKVKANLEAELIGVIASDCYSVFGEGVVAEYNTTGKNPRRAAKDVASLILAKHGGRRHDWTVRYDSARKLTSLLSDPRRATARTRKCPTKG